ncbi:hypothetical protein HOC80_04950 [archaeon]|jgi:hypothetical protein|nr:hypothetical protein [archaeon]MBT4417421.1 hypothetical protein [archaeon]
MAIKFVLDNEQRKNELTIEEILTLTNKKPYPSKDATHLATFLESCFDVIAEERRLEIQRKKIADFQKQKQIEEYRRKKAEEQRLRTIEMQAPIPVPPKAMEKREYVLNIYRNPIGILVEKNEKGIYIYNAIQPLVAERVFEGLKKFKQKAKENPNLLENNILIETNAKKAYAKANQDYNEHSLQKIKYYLQRDIYGTGVIDPLIFDENVRTITINGPKKPIQIEFSNIGKIKTNLKYKNNENINKLIQRLAKESHRTVNNDNPILDVIFQGLKIEATLGIGGANSRLTIKRL